MCGRSRERGTTVEAGLHRRKSVLAVSQEYVRETVSGKTRTMRRTMFALSLSMLHVACRAPAAETGWQHMPLRTAAQKAAGEMGGEMGQMVYTIAISPSAPQCMALGIDTAHFGELLVV